MLLLMALLLVQARRDRIVLPVWILGIAFMGFVVAGAVATEFGDVADRAAIVTVAAVSPAFLFLRGLPDGTGIGPVVFFQGYAFTAVLAGLMTTFLVIRHTRADEELGRAELLGSAPIPRAAPLMATLILGAVANLVLARCAAAGFAAAGLPGQGALMAGAAIGSVGIFFVAVAAGMAQAMPSGRAANGAAAGVVGAAFLLRGIGDAFGTPSADLSHVSNSWVSLFSPIGWGQRSRPFSAADPLPLLLLTAAGLALGAAVLMVRRRRDLGESLLPNEPAGSVAASGGSSLLGLAWRQQRATLIGWSIAGGLGPLVTDLIGSNESLRELIGRLVPGSRSAIIDVFTAALLGISGVLGAAAGIQVVLRLRAEEAEGRAELLLAAPRSRVRWLGANLLMACASVMVVALAAGAAAAAALALSGAAVGSPGLLIGAAVAHSPAAVVFVALTAVLFATVPRLSIPLAWGVFACGLVLGQFGELLCLPTWVQDVSPFSHSAAMPVEPFNPEAALLMIAIAVAGAAMAAFLLRRRDLTRDACPGVG